jgi:flagellar hook-basal body complex protein FliE
MSAIESIGAFPPVRPAGRVQRAASARPAEETKQAEGFTESLDAALEEVDGLQKRADRATLGLSTGEVEDVHQVMIAMNEADLSFRMMLEVRNRLVDAYKEIARLQI